MAFDVDDRGVQAEDLAQRKKESVVADEICTFQLYPNPKIEKCAMVIVDPENDFLHDRGHFAQSGVDISHMKRTIKPTIKMIDFCHQNDIPIIVSIHSFRQWDVDGGLRAKVRPGLQKGGLRTGSWGVEVLEEMDIDPDKDWILPKSRLSCFYNTKMELLMRNLGRDTLIVTGVLTNQCVESTIRDAQFRDIAVLELEDCVGTFGGIITHPITREEVVVRPEDLHEASLRAVTFGFGDVIQSDELIRELSKSPSLV